jgi:hypothetical protein
MAHTYRDDNAAHNGPRRSYRPSAINKLARQQGRAAARNAMQRGQYDIANARQRAASRHAISAYAL